MVVGFADLRRSEGEVITCEAEPSGSKCHVCAVWDEAMHRVRMTQGELASAKSRYRQHHDAMRSTIARLERRLKRLEQSEE